MFVKKRVEREKGERVRRETHSGELRKSKLKGVHSEVLNVTTQTVSLLLKEMHSVC